MSRKNNSIVWFARYLIGTLVVGRQSCAALREVAANLKQADYFTYLTIKTQNQEYWAVEFPSVRQLYYS